MTDSNWNPPSSGQQPGQANQQGQFGQGQPQGQPPYNQAPAGQSAPGQNPNQGQQHAQFDGQQPGGQPQHFGQAPGQFGQFGQQPGASQSEGAGQPQNLGQPQTPKQQNWGQQYGQQQNLGQPQQHGPNQGQFGQPQQPGFGQLPPQGPQNPPRPAPQAVKGSTLDWVRDIGSPFFLLVALVMVWGFDPGRAGGVSLTAVNVAPLITVLIATLGAIFQLLARFGLIPLSPQLTYYIRAGAQAPLVVTAVIYIVIDIISGFKAADGRFSDIDFLGVGAGVAISLLGATLALQGRDYELRALGGLHSPIGRIMGLVGKSLLFVFGGIVAIGLLVWLITSFMLMGEISLFTPLVGVLGTLVIILAFVVFPITLTALGSEPGRLIALAVGLAATAALILDGVFGLGFSIFGVESSATFQFISYMLVIAAPLAGLAITPHVLADRKPIHPTQRWFSASGLGLLVVAASALGFIVVAIYALIPRDFGFLGSLELEGARLVLTILMLVLALAIGAAAVLAYMSLRGPQIKASQLQLVVMAGGATAGGFLLMIFALVEQRLDGYDVASVLPAIYPTATLFLLPLVITLGLILPKDVRGHFVAAGTALKFGGARQQGQQGFNQEGYNQQGFGTQGYVQQDAQQAQQGYGQSQGPQPQGQQPQSQQPHSQQPHTQQPQGQQPQSWQGYGQNQQNQNQNQNQGQQQSYGQGPQNQQQGYGWQNPGQHGQVQQGPIQHSQAQQSQPDAQQPSGQPGYNQPTGAIGGYGQQPNAHDPVAAQNTGQFGGTQPNTSRQDQSYGASNQSGPGWVGGGQAPASAAPQTPSTPQTEQGVTQPQANQTPATDAASPFGHSPFGQPSSAENDQQDGPRNPFGSESKKNQQARVDASTEAPAESNAPVSNAPEASAPAAEEAPTPNEPVDLAAAARKALDPDTPSSELNWMKDHKELWPYLASAPSASNELLKWLGKTEDPTVLAYLKNRGYQA